MKPTRLLLTAASSLLVSQVMAGEAVFYLVEDGAALKDVAVTLNGQKRLTGNDGFVSFENLPAGSHSVSVSQMGEPLGEFSFDTTSAAQNAEVVVEMIGGEAIEEVVLFTPGQADAAAPGKIEGILLSDETAGPITGARVSVAGTEQGVMTDANGAFSLELPRGEYSLTISHPNYGKRDVRSVHVMGNNTTAMNMNLSMAGNGSIEEVVAVGSYIPTTGAAQERDSSAVLDAIGTEQMARFGDSNAASALKRVAGVTVSGGKYVVARGLNERHTSVVLNGSSLPSPDPSRRVVPLDLFPSTILDGIDVQKTATANVNADSTGSVVNLTTRKFPAEYEGKVSANLGMTEGLTFQQRTVQQSEGLDMLGLGAGGDRALPSAARDLNSDTASQAQKAAAARAMSSNLQTEEQSILPDGSLEVSVGDTLVENDDYSFGYTSSLKYSNEWSREDRVLNSNYISDGMVQVDDSFESERTSNDINLGMGVSLGLIAGENEYNSNTMLLRQTHAETTVKNGTGGDQDRQSVGYSMDWMERQFLLQQFTGSHYIESFGETDIRWQVSYSQASLNNPDRRDYSFEVPSGGSDYVLYWSTLDRTYNEMTDVNTDVGVDLKSKIWSGDLSSVTALYGVSLFDRNRDADGTQIGYSSTSATAIGYENVFDIDDIVSETINSGDTVLVNNSAASSDYKASWNYMAWYLGAEYEQLESFRFNIGARMEDSSIEVNTFTLSTGRPVDAVLEDSKVFLSTGATVHVTEDVQIRGAWYETQNRPDFRELANAQYTDPDTGDTVRGYDGLVSADISNYDLRGEWYFSDTENISLAYFMKDFTNPIEKTLLTGGDVYSYRNGGSGEVSGIEVDFRKEFELESDVAFLSGNFSVMDSEVEISGAVRAMQGQPDALANIQLGYDQSATGMEYTLVVNYQGESLYSASQVGSNSPDVIQEARAEVDFNYNYDLANDWVVKARIKNITDEEVSLTQAGNNYRSYKKGREFSAGFSYEF